MTKIVETEVVDTETGETTAPTGFKPKVLRLVTRPLFKWVKDVPKFYRIEEEMFRAEESATQKAKRLRAEEAGEKGKEPPWLLNVVDLETGQQGQCIVGTVLKSELESYQPVDAEDYVGCCFSIAQHKLENQGYSTWSIAQIECPVNG